MKTSYSERDYNFGEKMLTLRTAIGLTQAELANHLGISRRAVGEWEAGNSYPKSEHLKKLITLGVKQQAFAKGSAIEEIVALWRAAHQKVLLDERWLSTLLDQERFPHLRIVPEPAEESESPAPVMAEVPPGPRVDWGDALATPVFYGRERELAQLAQWIVQDRCRVVSVLGIGGIGKSALSVSTMYQQAEHFEVVIFHSLRDAPACETLLAECLQVLSPLPLSVLPATLEQRISLLLSFFRTNRVLVILDNLECLLQEGDSRGHFRPGFEGYGQLLRRVAETRHQSCLLITSREKPAELRPLEGKRGGVYSLRLMGLDVAACQQLLMEKEIAGTEGDQERLISLYGGNPLALKIVAETIIDLFSGEIGPFLSVSTLVFGSISDLLGEQFARLSALEQSVLGSLAIAREPMTLDELQAVLIIPRPPVQVLEALDGLHRRSLIERGKRLGSFTLQSVVLEYVTTTLVARASSEIMLGQLDLLIQHGLSQAHAKEYVRQTQERLLLMPLLANLQDIYLGRSDRSGQAQGKGAVGTVPCARPGASPLPTPTPTPMVPLLEGQLLGLLEGLRNLSDSAQGYGPANLIALLRLQRGHLSGLDLSNLCIRGAFFQGIEMQKTLLCGAVIRDTVWTSAVSETWSVAVDQDGSLWAAGGAQGEVRVWGEGGRALQLMWQAHTDAVMTLAFSPNGRMLASGGLDNTVKLWDVANGTLLWMDWRNVPYNLAFAPDSNMLACSEMGPSVPIWDTHSGTNLQTLTHPAHVFAIAWSPDGTLLASSCVDGQLRLWERLQSEPETRSEIFRLSTSWECSPVMSLAFAPDGRTLVSSGREDRKVKLWEVGSGRLLHTFEGETNQVSRVAFSPDGRTLASSSSEQAIQLWNVEQRRHRATLYGHACDINDMVFTPDSRSLLSGSNDSTMRVWDVESGECVRVMQGYAVSYYSLDWSPDGRYLVSGGTDGVVTIWDVSGETPPRALHGHTWFVSAVGWSPEGRFVASCGWDKVVRLWNPTSGICVQILRGPRTTLVGMAWSPDGSLLAVGTFLEGMYVWDITEGRPHWVGEPGRTVFFSAAWSPDGSLLAGGSNDGSVYLWEREDGTRRERLSGQRGNVRSVAWSPDGRLLSIGSGELLVWNVLTGECVQTIAQYPDRINAVAWNRSHGACPRGDQVISGGSDGRLRWWDVKTGECVNMQETYHGMIRFLKVSPDGKLLASCGNDGAIRIWDLTSRKHVRTLRRDRPYERLNITGIRGLTEAEIASLRALGAIECDSFAPKP
jgi:WD40 repeat protein/transcriptional regulator with XRE-family HTH domain